MGKAAAVRAALTAAADGALALVLAPLCAACRRPLDHPTAGAVCASCWAAIVPITPPCCRTCGDPLPSWRTLSVEESCCARCRRRPPLISLARAIGAYEGPLRGIIQAFKYDGRESIGRALAERMRLCAAAVLDGVDGVVPVPLHRSRERARGFNQARELARHLGVPVLDVLQRTRKTVSQADLPAARRHANVRGAFGCRADVDGRVLVLVDDVSTTGATLSACAAALLAAGARDVRALTAARAMVRRP